MRWCLILKYDDLMNINGFLKSLWMFLMDIESKGWKIALNVNSFEFPWLTRAAQDAKQAKILLV